MLAKFDYKMATNNSGGDVGGNKTGAELDKLLYSYMELHERLDEAMKKLEDAQREVGDILSAYITKNYYLTNLGVHKNVSGTRING